MIDSLHESSAAELPQTSVFGRFPRFQTSTSQDVSSRGGEVGRDRRSALFHPASLPFRLLVARYRRPGPSGTTGTLLSGCLRTLSSPFSMTISLSSASIRLWWLQRFSGLISTYGRDALTPPTWPDSTETRAIGYHTHLTVVGVTMDGWRPCSMPNAEAIGNKLGEVVFMATGHAVAIPSALQPCPPQ